MAIDRSKLKIRNVVEEYPTESSKVFMLEKNKLNFVLTKLNNRISYLKNNIPYPDVHTYSTGIDKDDRENLRFQKRINENHAIEIDETLALKNSLYFARMDFVSERINSIPELIKMYVGKQSIRIGNERLVYDWRSPIGQRYYIKQDLAFKYNEYSYELILRRAFSINNEVLEDIYEEYFDTSILTPQAKVSYEKNSDKPTNINIIEGLEKNITDPFLLKALREKRGDYQLTDIIRTIQSNQNDIIRCSLQDNIVIQGCAGSGKTMILLHRLSYLKFNNPTLNLENVKILTPNELFDLHINNLSKSLDLDKIERLTVEKYYINLLNVYGKVWSVSANNIFPESNMNQDLINYIYSLEFAKKMKVLYKEWAQNISLVVIPINDIVKKLNLSIDDNISPNSKRKIEAYKSIISRILSKNSGISKETKEKLDEINRINDDIYRNENDLKSNESNKAGLMDALIIFINQKITEQINIKSSLCEELKQNIESRKNRLLEIESQKSDASKGGFKILRTILRWGKLDENSKTKNIKREISILENELEENTKFIIQYEKKIVNKTNDFTLDDANEMITDSEFQDKKIIDGIFYIKAIEDDISRITKENALKLKNNDEIIVKIKELEKQMLTSDEKMKVGQADEQLNSINEKNVYNKIFNTIISSMFDLSKIKNLDRDNRAFLYSKLMFCYLFYGKPYKTDRLLCIDEGQDLSYYEYEIIKQINGGIIFNIYGDTNQLIKTGRGLDTWDKVIKSNEAKSFILNENYRNSIEITKYCNKKFGFNATTVGISCGEVEEISHKDFINAINNTEIGKIRIAFIFKDEADIYLSGLKEILESNRIIRNEVVNGKISLLNIEQAKGLEFDVVYVLPKAMSKNEKYIAYTRALGRLIVVE